MADAFMPNFLLRQIEICYDNDLRVIIEQLKTSIIDCWMRVTGLLAGQTHIPGHQTVLTVQDFLQKKYT